jgi:hypothetical protein
LQELAIPQDKQIKTNFQLGGAMRFIQVFLAIFFITLTLLTAGISAQSLIMTAECATYDASRDRFLISCRETGRIVQIDSNGVESIFWPSALLAGSSYIDGDLFYVSIGNEPGSVAVLDLETGALIKTITIGGSAYLDGMTTDSSGNLYVVDRTRDWIYKIDLNTEFYTYFAMVSRYPQDIYFDSLLNRLIVVEWHANASIQQVSLPDGAVSDIVPTSFGYMDGIARDNQGRYYVSCWNRGEIYRYDSDFANPPTLVSSGHDTPTNICLDLEHNILAVPSDNGARVDFVGLDAEFVADISLGKVPLTVNFTGSSINYPLPDSWLWNFGDGGTAEGQTVSYTYTSSGLQAVDLGVVVGSETFHRRKKNFIFVQADTLIGAQIGAIVGSKIVVPIYVRNSAPLKKIVIPFNYSGDVVLQCDSVSTAGCTTSGFPTQTLYPFDDTNKKLALTLSGGLLEPGRNLVANVYMTVISAAATRTTDLTFNAISTYQPRFTWNLLDYTPDFSAGRVVNYTCGDANSDTKINLLDVSYIISSLYRSGPKPNPIQSADVNHDGKLNLLDVSYIISFLYRHGPAPSCP